MSEHRLAAIGPENLDTTKPYPPQPHTARCSCGRMVVGENYAAALGAWQNHAGRQAPVNERDWLRDRNAKLRLANSQLQRKLNDIGLLAEQWLRLPGTELQRYAADLKQLVDRDYR
jgi:hypothetical protein